ncbi:phosphocholine-specific phospholipase C [Granulicella mallensis]|uniref:phospholipase C n=1 Tax=Granulicella mallensis (strain ATCC BAA-1857 / DSM 23137 / MP5ACTX8) TaxID=682795 RepID=G8NSM9_GRAMM|nr:phospholipase C, phosphocholine-specific [Granulicella mallensis]AEU35128.1 phospholipase C, phosphocholine-specific [Granulicella mallensis MP5ACTX8]
MPTDRRTFLQLLSTGALSAAFPASIARALEIPANHKTGSINDIEHIVILMQENRSFDHYFGTLRGVRGYGDPRAVTLSSGKPVWNQPNGSSEVLPFHPGAPNLGLQFIQDLAHDWTTTHAAWNEGNNDQWVPQKGTTTMAHLNRSDIPFHYALADAFTICDAYHCSLLGPTDPNRYYMWTGWVGNDGSGGGPVVDNAEAGYGWSTFPERLQQAGVSWKIYQDIGLGLTAAESWGFTSDAYIGNYGDNSLLYFHQYQNAVEGSALANGAKTGTDISASGKLFDNLRSDVASGKLPQVSWIVAPEAYTEHPNWPANYGAWYVSQILDALTSNPEVWSKTAFLLTYDENDGFFDHVVPPTVPQTRAQGLSTVSIANEIFEGSSEYPAGPYGMGMRVPMMVISPWSKGGWVNSEVFDHTSIIRFIEQRFGKQYPGLQESNITPWRRAVAGDLTSAFNFESPNSANVPLPSTVAYMPPDDQRHPDYVPAPPAVQAVPVQESGTRPARAVPYEPNSYAVVDSNGSVEIFFQSASQAAVVFQVRSGNTQTAPRTYTVGGGKTVSDTWTTSATAGAYDLSVYGPNGFLRSYKGSASGGGKANFEVKSTFDPALNLVLLTFRNLGETCKLNVEDTYSGKSYSAHFVHGQTVTQPWLPTETFGWYDFIVTVDTDSSFEQRLSGHIETGRDSMTDPAIAATPKQ